MKRLAAISVLCAALFATALAARGSASPASPRSQRSGGPVPEWADSLRSLYLYTEGVKRYAIEGDSARACDLFREAIRADSTFAPAYYGLAVSQMEEEPAAAAEMAGRASRLDTADLWYRSLHGQALVRSGRYRPALGVFRELQRAEPNNPDNYRILAALYELDGQPYMAIVTLDTAEVRFGRIPMLSAMKRQLLVSTR